MLSFIEKYRPKRYLEIIGQEEALNSLFKVLWSKKYYNKNNEGHGDLQKITFAEIYDELVNLGFKEEIEKELHFLSDDKTCTKNGVKEVENT